MFPVINRRALVAALATLMLSVPAFAGDASQFRQVAAAPVAVTIKDYAFNPPVVTVAPGTTVTWTNQDGPTHGVLSADGGATFKSPPLESGKSFSFTFTKPGTYAYRCLIHSSMKGTVVVK